MSILWKYVSSFERFIALWCFCWFSKITQILGSTNIQYIISLCISIYKITKTKQTPNTMKIQIKGKTRSSRRNAQIYKFHFWHITINYTNCKKERKYKSDVTCIFLTIAKWRVKQLEFGQRHSRRASNELCSSNRKEYTRAFGRSRVESELVVRREHTSDAADGGGSREVSGSPVTHSVSFSHAHRSRSSQRIRVSRNERMRERYSMYRTKIWTIREDYCRISHFVCISRQESTR